MAPNELIGKKMLGLSNPVHMDIIDKLRDLGVHEFVDLPQLVVVGDQSSGKSSVLESIMDIPLPRDASLCTRFATNIIFRRQKMRKVAISIMPGKTSNAEKEKRLRLGDMTRRLLMGDFSSKLCRRLVMFDIQTKALILTLLGGLPCDGGSIAGKLL